MQDSNARYPHQNGIINEVVHCLQSLVATHTAHVNILLEGELLLVENKLLILGQNALARNFEIPGHFQNARLYGQRALAGVTMAFRIHNNTIKRTRVKRNLNNYRNSQLFRKNSVNHALLMFLLLLNNQM